MSNISIFGTLENVTDGALAKGTQIVGGRMSVATIAERDAIPESVRKDGTEVYVTATKLTYRWNAAANAFEEAITNGAEGLSIYKTSANVTKDTTQITGSTITVPSGHTIKEGDFLLAVDSGSLLFTVTSYNGTIAFVHYETQITGLKGADGATWHNTTNRLNTTIGGTATISAEAWEGDYILSTEPQSNGYYGKVTGGTHVQPLVTTLGCLLGPQGEKGDTGATGPQGPKGDPGTNYGNGTGRRLIWSSEEGAQVTGEIGFNPIGKTFDVEFAIGSDKPTSYTCRFTCTSSDNSTSPLQSDSVSLFYPFSNYSVFGLTTTRYAGYSITLSYFYRLTNESELQYKFRINRTQECRTDTVYTTSVDGTTTTMTSTQTVVNSLNNGFVHLYNLYLIEGTTAIENHTIVTSAWTALSGSAPYTYSAMVTVSAEISETSIIELYNNNAVLFAKYGFAIGAVSGQNVTVYAIGQPTESVTLTIQVGG